jgi:hypothetical protein
MQIKLRHSTALKTAFAVIILSISCITGSIGQTTLKIASKSLKEHFNYLPGMEVNVEGQKAEIVIETWDKNSVEILIDFIAKHPSEMVAKKDLKSIKYSFKTIGNKVYFRNFIKSEDGSSPQAQLKATYTIRLPNTCPVYVKNHFGSTHVSELTKSFTLNSEFSEIILKDLKGIIDVQTKYGDITGDGIHGNVSMNARRSDITLTDISGDFDVYTAFGIVKLFTDHRLLNSLNIDGEQSDVYIFDPLPSSYGYELTAHYGSITTPRDLKFNYIENNQSIKKAVFIPSKEMASISINITFGDIIIRNP